MNESRFSLVIGSFLCVSIWGACFADEIIYQYEGDVMPYEAPGNWGHSRCDEACSESLDAGRYVTVFNVGNGASYNHTYFPGLPWPSNVWAEVGHRTDHAFPGGDPGCNVFLSIGYAHSATWVGLFSNRAINDSGNFFLASLPMDEFHAVRFESPDEYHFAYSANGKNFWNSYGEKQTGTFFFQLIGLGGCGLAYLPATNEWDYFRYGTLSYGEDVIASEPTMGHINARAVGPLTRFTVAFDEPNFIFVNQISVEASAGSTPAVQWTRRCDTCGPETVEVVLTQPIPIAATTTFTFDDGVAQNIVDYKLFPGDTEGDGDADLSDIAAFFNCFDQPADSRPCYALNFDANESIDLADFADPTWILTGP